MVHEGAVFPCIVRKKTPGSKDSSTSGLSVDHETRQTVREAVQQLKLPYREIVQLYYYENYSTGQIAAMLDSPPSTIRQQLFRARKMLAQLLNKEDFDR